MSTAAANRKLMEEEACLKTLMHVSLKDGTLSPSELTYYKTIGRSFGFTAEEMDAMARSVQAGEESLEQLTASVGSVRMKLWLVSELVSLCYADGDYSLAEKNGLREICRLLELDEASLQEVENSFGEDGSGDKLLANMRSFFSEETAATIALARQQLSAALAHAAAAGINTIGSEIPFSLADAVSRMDRNRQIRQIVSTEKVSDAVKEKLTAQLSASVSACRKQLAAASDEDLAFSLQTQIDDLLQTIRAVSNS